MKNPMKICKVCVLPETFPGIRFDEEGVCQFCRAAKPADENRQVKEKYRKKFQDLVDQKRNGPSYDAIVAYSGGKDSSYTVKLLKEGLGMSVLAVTFDNGFLSEMAVRNIRQVAGALRVDHLMASPSFGTLSRAFNHSAVTKIYPVKALERATSICNTCMHLAKAILTKTAIEMGVPFIAYGWSPGQAPIPSSVLAMNASMIRQQQAFLKKSFYGELGEDLRPLLLQERHYRMLEETASGSKTPALYNVHPLAFFDYDEEKVLEDIKALGWVSPEDTDSNSTNCLLNAFAIQAHMNEWGFHPYAMEIATLVRDGYMTREQGLDKLTKELDEKMISYVREKLGTGA